MAASVAFPGRPRTLTDRHHDISTVDRHRSPAGFTPREVNNHDPELIDIVFHSGKVIRHVNLRIENFPAPSWVEPTVKNCAHLLLLPSGWDGETAPPVNGSAIQAAFDALCLFMADASSPPQWTPTRDGGVQLDWHERALDLEIEFDPNTSSGRVVFGDQLDDTADYAGPLDDYIERLRSVFSERLDARVER